MQLEDVFTLSLTASTRGEVAFAVSKLLLKLGAAVLESSEYSDLETGAFFLRTAFCLKNPQDLQEIFDKELAALAQKLKLKWELTSCKKRPRLLLLVSKASHCLNALLYQWKEKRLQADIAAIVSNHLDLEEYAQFYQVPFYHFPLTELSKAEQEKSILDLAKKERIDLLVLARYMQILSKEFVQKTFGKTINIHHSFLPSFKGAKPYHQAHKKGVKLIGATAHYVTENLDEGPIIEQDVVRIDHSVTAEECVFLGQDVESSVLLRAVRYHLEGRVFIDGIKTVVLR